MKEPCYEDDFIKVTIKTEYGKYSARVHGYTIFALMEAFRRAMKKAGYTKRQRRAVKYDHMEVLRGLNESN